MRGHPKIDARLAELDPDDTVVTSVVTRGEVLHGLARLPSGKRRKALEAKAAGLFAQLSCEPVPVAAAEHYADIKLVRQQSGLGLDENDL